MKRNGAGSSAALDILLVEDNRDLGETVEEALCDAGHRVVLTGDGEEAMARTQTRVFDAVLTDVHMPKMDGLTLFRRLRQECPTTEVIIMTSHGEVAQAVAAMKDGAYDYLVKPFSSDEVLLRLSRIASHRALQRELDEARAALSSQQPEAVLLGQSPGMRRVLSLIEAVSQSDAATLVTGESGTGKELVARMLHDRSPRRARPFIAVNCGALTESLVEAELFGHERGAFTGAERKREGRFKAADGGTLFLDEIAELPATAQAKLLRVLQEGTFEPIGTNTPIKVDVRLVAATHRNLPDRIRDGLFREDLYYRVNVIEINLPPLRDRPGDMTLLAQQFLRRFTSKDRPVPPVAPAAWDALKQYRYPGNVRELSHAIQHAVVLSGGKEIGVHHLPGPIMARAAVAIPAAAVSEAAAASNEIQPLAAVMRTFERAYLARIMSRADGNRARTAETLGISRKTLWEKLKLYGIGAEASGEAGAEEQDTH